MEEGSAAPLIRRGGLIGGRFKVLPQQRDDQIGKSLISLEGTALGTLVKISWQQHRELLD